MPKQASCSYPPWHVFLDWEVFPAGNACRDSNRGINLLPRVCLCTWVHIHSHTSYPKGRICCIAAQRAWMLPEQPATPAALLRAPHDSQIICPSVFNPAGVILLSFITCLIILLWLALTPVKATLWDPAQRSQTPHELQSTHRPIAAPQPWPAAPLCLLLFAMSPGLACTLRLWQTALTKINAAFHWEKKKIYCCPICQLEWKEIMQSSIRQHSAISVTSFIDGFTRCSAARS